MTTDGEIEKLKKVCKFCKYILSCPMCDEKLEQIDSEQLDEVGPRNAKYGFQCNKCPFTIFW